MNAHNGVDKDERLVPITVVLAFVVIITLLTIVAIWVVVPTTRPDGVGDLIATVLTHPLDASISVDGVGKSGRQDVSNDSALVRNAGNSQALLPETPFGSGGSLSQTAFIGEPGDKLTRRGIPVRIVIPAIDLDAPVTAVSLQLVEVGGGSYYQWQVPDRFAAGWHNDSALLGDGGNTVLNGHHNINGEVFRHVVDLEPGDKIFLYDSETPRQYVVSMKEIFPERGEPLEVRLKNASWITATNDERVTLVTCWPYSDNTHRVVVVARPSIEMEEE